MVSLKEKPRAGSTRVSVGDQSHPSVSCRNFKVFSEIDRTKAGDGLMASAREAGAASRRGSVIVNNKGIISNSACNPKDGFKSMEKSSTKYGTSTNMNVRKALIDVTNAQGNSATATTHNFSKTKISAGSANKKVGISLRKSFMGIKQRNTSQGEVQEDAPDRGLRASVEDQKNNTNGGRSVLMIKDRFARKPMLPTTTSTATKSLPAPRMINREYMSNTKLLDNIARKSLPVPRRVNRPDMNKTKLLPNISRKSLPVPRGLNKADMNSTKLLPNTSRKSLPAPGGLNRVDVNNTKDTGSSETTKGLSGLPGKATTGRRAGSQLTNLRSHLWKTRVSDGCVEMVQPNFLQASSRKFTKPIVKTTLKVSMSQRTLKSKSIAVLNKSKLIAAMSSKDDKTVTPSLLESCSVVVSDDAIPRCQPSDGESSLRTDLSELIPKKKSTRRKSYTTSLIERTKFLKENEEVKEQDNLPNIDDGSNHLEVSEYIDEIYQYYWVTEAHSEDLANYISIQTEITPQMRSILINWLIEVHYKFDLMPETLYLTVTLLDQYLSQVAIKKTDMQLVGLTALLLASKYEDFWHPRVKDLISISAESYTRDQMLRMEKLILRKLKFRLNSPTPYVFMVRFLKAAQSDTTLDQMAFFLIDLCLVEYEALAFKPSLLCASALYVARCTLQITPPWTPLLHKHAHYEVSQMRDCADMILKFQKAAGKGKLKVVYEKYSRKELSGVATVKPLVRLPQ